MKVQTKSIKEFVKELALYYYRQKQTRDHVERSFEDARYEFKQQMDRYFDMAADDDGKLEIDVGKNANFAGLKSLVMTRVQPAKVIWDVEGLRGVLSKEQRKQVLRKKHTVTNWGKLFKLLKDAGVDWHEFLKCISITEEVDEKALEKLVDLGEVNEDEVKACSEVKLGTPSYRFTEKK